jgi:hypothetical protein
MRIWPAEILGYGSKKIGPDKFSMWTNKNLSKQEFGAIEQMYMPNLTKGYNCLSTSFFSGNFRG